MKSLLAAFFAQVAIVTYRNVHGGGVKTPTQAPLPVPLPSQYVAPAVVYGFLAILPDSFGPIPGLIGWGLVVATLIGAGLTKVAPVFVPGSDITSTTGKTARGSDTYGGGGTPGPVVPKGA